MRDLKIDAPQHETKPCLMRRQKLLCVRYDHLAVIKAPLFVRSLANAATLDGVLPCFRVISLDHAMEQKLPHLL